VIKMKKKILSVRDLVVEYVMPSTSLRAVDKVTFEVNDEEIFGIVGESGSGKSTLAKAVLRLLEPPGYIRSGHVNFEGINLIELNEEELNKIRWRKISYVPQSSMNALNPLMKIGDQIIEVIKTHGFKNVSKEVINRQIEELLVSVGLAPEVARMYPHELSGGMRQRVIIAMATVFNPVLIVADEPTTALDVVVQRGILQLLNMIKIKYKSSIILISHDIAVQAEVADKIAVMYAGKIVEIGNIRDVLKKPLHPYTQALISSTPSNLKKEVLKGLSGNPPDLRQLFLGCRFYPRCKYYKPGLCDKVEPHLQKIGDRLVACHLYT
jgi:peptide/nickel transport system ATP-binding protein